RKPSRIRSTPYVDLSVSRCGSSLNGLRGTPAPGSHSAYDVGTADRMNRNASSRFDLPEALAPKTAATGTVGRSLSYAGSRTSSCSSRIDRWLATRKLRSNTAPYTISRRFLQVNRENRVLSSLLLLFQDLGGRVVVAVGLAGHPVEALAAG